MPDVELEDLLADGTVDSAAARDAAIAAASLGALAFGGARLVDLGVIEATDLIAGPIDLNATVGVVAGEFVTFFMSADGYVAHDSGAVIMLQSALFQYWSWNTGAVLEDAWSNGSNQYPGYISDGGAINLELTGSDPTLGAVHLYAMVVGATAVGARNVDLGVINAVDLIGSPLDLNETIQAQDGDMVAILVAADGFVAHDSDAVIRVAMYGGDNDVFGWGSSDSDPGGVASNSSQLLGIVSDGGALNLELTGSDPTVGSIHLRAIVIGPSSGAGVSGFDPPIPISDVDLLQQALDSFQPASVGLSLIAAGGVSQYAATMLTKDDAEHVREYLEVLSAVVLGAAGGRTVRVVDCGVIDVTDGAFTAPPRLATVFTPDSLASAVVKALIFVPDADDLLVGNIDMAIGTVVGQGDNGDGHDWINWSIGMTAVRIVEILEPNGDQVFAGFNTGLLTPFNVWLTTHVYAPFEGVFEEGHIWYADDPGGTSGATIPDFAQGIIDGSVVDGDITWFDDDTPPTSGSGRLFVVVESDPAVNVQKTDGSDVNVSRRAQSTGGNGDANAYSAAQSNEGTADADSVATTATGTAHANNEANAGTGGSSRSKIKATYAGDDVAEVVVEADEDGARLIVNDGTSPGEAGQALVSNGAGKTVWQPGLIKSVIRISSAELLDLFDTPVQIAPAPGVGKAYMTICNLAVFKADTTPYDATGVGSLGWFPAGDPASYVVSVGSSLLESVDDNVAGGTTMGNPHHPFAVFDNKALMFGAVTGNPADGDGTLIVTTIYTIIDVA